MRRSLAIVVSLCAALAFTVPARAQDAPLSSASVAPPLTDAQARELDAWLEGIRKWQRFDARWHNAAAHDAFGRIIPRRHRPETPAWLDARCAALSPELAAALHSPLGDACRVLASLSVDLRAETIRTERAAQRADREAPVKHSFLTRLHIDGLWTTTSTDTRLYGLVGSHISLVDIGRVQFFGPPGVIVMSVPDGRGSREIRMGYTWGMSVRLGDIRLFSPTKNVTLFLTMTKVWLTGGTYDRLNPGGFDIAGFSIAPRKK